MSRHERLGIACAVLVVLAFGAVAVTVVDGRDDQRAQLEASLVRQLRQDVRWEGAQSADCKSRMSPFRKRCTVTIRNPDERIAYGVYIEGDGCWLAFPPVAEARYRPVLEGCPED